MRDVASQQRPPRASLPVRAPVANGVAEKPLTRRASPVSLRASHRQVLEGVAGSQEAAKGQRQHPGGENRDSSRAEGLDQTLLGLEKPRRGLEGAERFDVLDRNPGWHIRALPELDSSRWIHRLGGVVREHLLSREHETRRTKEGGHLN